MQYDFQKVNLIINYSGGTHYVTGFSSGSTIDAQRDGDRYTKHVGAKGDVTLAINNDNSGTIKFKLKNDSSSNKILNFLEQTKEEFTANIYDSNSNGKGKAGGSDCVVMKDPGFIRGNEVQELEWTIGVPTLSIDYD